MLDPKCVSVIAYAVIISNVILYSLQTIATHTCFVGSATIRIFLNKGEINLEMALNCIEIGKLRL